VRRGTSDALLCQIDFLASFSALTGQPLAAGALGDSVDTMDAFLGRSKVGRNELVEQGSGLALRIGRWKYIEPGKGPKRNANTNTELGNDALPQLYDLSQDPGETRNLAPQQPDRVKAMQTRLDRIRKERD
jgi:arylsulfatase A-like enzyme